MHLDRAEPVVPPRLGLPECGLQRLAIPVGKHQGMDLLHRLGLAKHASDFRPLTGSQFEGDLQCGAGVEARPRPARKPRTLHRRRVAH